MSEISRSALDNENTPIMFIRADLCTTEGLQEICEVCDGLMKSMITSDLPTRRLLHPLIQQRFQTLEAAKEYISSELEVLRQDLPDVDEQQMFDMVLHDFYKIFEVDEVDGLIKLREMFVGLLENEPLTGQRIDSVETGTRPDRNDNIDIQETGVECQAKTIAESVTTEPNVNGTFETISVVTTISTQRRLSRLSLRLLKFLSCNTKPKSENPVPKELAQKSKTVKSEQLNRAQIQLKASLNKKSKAPVRKNSLELSRKSFYEAKANKSKHKKEAKAKSNEGSPGQENLNY